MRIVCCDDEVLAMDVLKRSICSLHPTDEVLCFEDPQELMKSIEETKPDVAFLDVRMRTSSGTELARKILSVSPLTDIVFASAHSTYALIAFELGASDFLLKPITPQKAQHAFMQLRHHPQETDDGRLSIRCFGAFEVFFKGEPVVFKRAKAKEMLAYLTARAGACCTKQELMQVLFGESNSVYYGVAKMEMIRALEALGLGDVIVNHHNQLGIARESVACDYFDWLEGKIELCSCFHGQFMDQYPWSKDLSHTILGL